MQIIIEGPDGSGKTTFIDMLIGSKRWFTLLRTAGPPPSLLIIVQYLAWIANASPRMPLILDRIPVISDRIYGPILRNADIFRDKPLAWMLTATPLIIYCRPPLDVIVKNVAATRASQLAGVEENTRAIVQGYDEHMAKLVGMALNVVQYDYTEDEFEPFARKHVDVWLSAP